MSDVKWIKIMTNLFEDEKIKIIESMPNGDTLLVIWVKLLIQAGKCNTGGSIQLTENIPYSNEMLTVILGRSAPNVNLALKTFQELGLINYSNSGVCNVTNWEKYQNTFGLDKIREKTRDRVAKFRQKQADVTLRNATPLISNSLSNDLLIFNKEDNNEIRDISPLPHPLQAYINTYLPNVNKMKQQLSTADCERILADFPRNRIKETLEAMENKKDLTKKYLSVNLTLRNWLKRDGNGTHQQSSGNGKSKRGEIDKDEIEAELIKQYGKKDTSGLFEG